MRHIIPLLALSAFACDDAEVASKVATALERGVVAADANCECDMRNEADTTTQHFGPYRVQVLLDGSCFANGSFRARYDECVIYPGHPFSIADGEFRSRSDSNPENRYSAPVSTCCTGFNLEAFGVE